jgi:glucokinase
MASGDATVRPALAAGIDVGGTKCLGVVVDAAGEIVREERVPTPQGSEPLIGALRELAGLLAPFDTLGVGIAGLVTRSGVLRAAPNLTIDEELPVAERLSADLDVPVYVDNDATCATVAEWRLGAARGESDVLMITLGTGIGGGVVSGGVLQRGENGFAGEFGHMVVDPDGPQCPCGRRGCWERYASGKGLSYLAGGRQGEDVVAAARAGDAEASAVIERYGWWVALGLVNLTNALDPGMFVLGGGLAATPDVFIGPIRTAFHELLYSPDHRPHPRLAFAELGEHAGALGAALLGREPL